MSERPYVLHQGDALEVMRGLGEGSVDAIITDPPYGTTQNDYEGNFTDWPAFYQEAGRILQRPFNLVMFAAQPFAAALITTAPDLFRYDLIWSKSLPTGHLNARHQPLRKHEHILVFGQFGATYNPAMRDKIPRGIGQRSPAGAYGEYRSDAPPIRAGESEGWPYSIVEHKTAYHEREAGQHPSQKPTGLLSYLVRTYTNPGDLILDPFAGSGTTGVAALQEGRRFIGVELSAEYHAVATRRLDAAYAQPRLLEAAEG